MRNHIYVSSVEVRFSRQEPIALSANLPLCFWDLKSSSAVVATDML